MKNEIRADGHVALKCKPQKDGNPAHYDDGRQCPYCEEEILACKICGGIEGSLTIQCPGYRLNEDIEQLVYKGLLDYQRGRWCVRELREWDKPPLDSTDVEIATIMSAFFNVYLKQGKEPNVDR